MTIFQHTDYKTAIRWLIEEKKRSGEPVGMASLSEACQVQAPYLSKVMNRDGHLSSDQLHLICDALKLKQKEARYLSLIHEAERSNVKNRKEMLLREASKIQSKALNTENYISAESIRSKNDELMQYYLNPTMQLVHFFLTIPRYAENTKLIEKPLSLETSELKLLLSKLTKLNFVKFEKRKWVVLKSSIHLSSTEDIYPSYRVLLRAKSIDKLLKSTNKKDYSFSVVFSADESTRKVVSEKFMSFLTEVESIVKKAIPSEVYQINFDLLSWSDF